MYFPSGTRQDIPSIARPVGGRSARSGWGEPHVLPSPVNAGPAAGRAPSVTSNGTLYFASNRDGVPPTSPLVNCIVCEVEKLGPQINSSSTRVIRVMKRS